MKSLINKINYNINLRKNNYNKMYICIGSYVGNTEHSYRYRVELVFKHFTIILGKLAFNHIDTIITFPWTI